MKFLYNSFKAKKKQIVKVNVSRATKVKLMTAFDLKKYKQGRTHRYRGGYFEDSPVIFRLPSDGIWYVVVEKGTSSAPIEVDASVELLPPDKKTKESTALDAPKPVQYETAEEPEDHSEGVELEEGQNEEVEDADPELEAEEDLEKDGPADH